VSGRRLGRVGIAREGLVFRVMGGEVLGVIVKGAFGISERSLRDVVWGVRFGERKTTSNSVPRERKITTKLPP
jgi:hypothetical protein